jgi:hypothetical protein
MTHSIKVKQAASQVVSLHSRPPNLLCELLCDSFSFFPVKFFRIPNFASSPSQDAHCSKQADHCRNYSKTKKQPSIRDFSSNMNNG